ncbi:MAG: porin family protein [Gammaproteobacteria bacterium]|nr:porin family protein [Gammaproteobacteria bacterium]MDH4254037.1 porin family protein [Gammaproteobacteria bacterium]MDH5310336.1 porin family protein [Gammaproteobacteria bacterium]
MRIFSSLLLLLAAPTLALAQGYGGTRGGAGTWEWAVAGIYQDSESATSGGGSAVTMDSAVGLGFNIGYYLNDRIMLGGEIEWLSPDYDATLISEGGDQERISHSLSQFNFRFKGTFNLLEGPFTPYVDLNAGWTYFDSNVADGPPIVGCWWVWPWGYICDGYYNTYTETSFSYGAGLGLRYRFTGGAMLKLSYNGYVLDDIGSASDPSLSAAKLEVAFGF